MDTGMEKRFLGYVVREVGGRSYLIRADDCREEVPKVRAVAVFWNNAHAEEFRQWFAVVLKYAEAGEKAAGKRATKRRAKVH